MEPYGNQWEPMESHGNEIKAKVWESMGVHANQLEPNGNEWTIRVVGDSADPERPHTPAICLIHIYLEYPCSTHVGWQRAREVLGGP